MDTHTRLGSAVQTDTPAVVGSRKSHWQQGRVLEAADKGQGCAYVMMPGGMVQRVVAREATLVCVSCLEGQVGELEGVVRLLGSSMIPARVPT